MKATHDNLKHLPIGSFVLLQFESAGHAEDGQIRLAQIGEYHTLRSLPVFEGEFRNLNHAQALDPSKWETQLNERHVILKVWMEETVWVNRKIDSGDVGLIVVGKMQNDNTGFAASVRFRLHEVENGYARVKDGGSHRILDYTWWVDPNSRLPEPTPTEELVSQYTKTLQQTIDEGGDHMVDWPSLFEGFGEEYARRFAREHGVHHPAFYSDADADA